MQVDVQLLGHLALRDLTINYSCICFDRSLLTTLWPSWEQEPGLSRHCSVHRVGNSAWHIVGAHYACWPSTLAVMLVLGAKYILSLLMCRACNYGRPAAVARLRPDDCNTHVLCARMWWFLLWVNSADPRGAQMLGQTLLCVFLWGCSPISSTLKP